MLSNNLADHSKFVLVHHHHHLDCIGSIQSSLDDDGGIQSFIQAPNSCFLVALWCWISLLHLGCISRDNCATSGWCPKLEKMSSSASAASTSSSKNSILGNLPSFDASNFSKPNPRSNLKPPKLYYNHSKPKQIVTTDRTSLLQRYFEKLHLSSNSNNMNHHIGSGSGSSSSGVGSSSTDNNNNGTKRSVTSETTTPYDRPTKTLKFTL